MIGSIRIDLEAPDDADEICALTSAAFAGHPHSSGTEAAIIRALRADGDLLLSLVARDGAQIVGHVAFSPVTIGDAAGTWFGLGPVSVLPDRQRAGIGRALIEAGLAALHKRAAAGCVLIGNPSYYERFGFRSTGALTYGELDTAYVMGLAFSGKLPSGEIIYAPGFAAT